MQRESRVSSSEAAPRGGLRQQANQLQVRSAGVVLDGTQLEKPKAQERPPLFSPGSCFQYKLPQELFEASCDVQVNLRREGLLGSSLHPDQLARSGFSRHPLSINIRQFH
ncbi:hypothetical protein NDU88_006880 [Pleurodeles waltl]|uniref:Uncharacterized protein n=1 Tax=Pleurodeles waltl TaxID=8319 RepID=A0AAV7PJN5_PLEWA|nr:hypothetical protein NDU88_006880 [Pleurodeles waltl]